MTDLGTLGGQSIALAINSGGQIVGDSDAPRNLWYFGRKQ